MASGKLTSGRCGEAPHKNSSRLAGLTGRPCAELQQAQGRDTAHALTQCPVVDEICSPFAPAYEARKALAEDGLLLDDAEPFDTLPEHCQALADKVNTAGPA